MNVTIDGKTYRVIQIRGDVVVAQPLEGGPIVHLGGSKAA